MNGSPPRIPKKLFPVALGIADTAFSSSSVDRLCGAVHLHPAALAPQIAAGDDRDEQERREVLAALETLLVPFHRTHAFNAEEVVEALALDLGAERAAALEAEIDAGLARWRERMPARVVDTLRRESRARRLLEAHGLPRLSLFHLEAGGAT